MYTLINKGFTQIMEYSTSDIIGKTSIELNIWYDLNDRDILLKELKKNEYVENLEAKFCTKNGKIIDGLMSSAIIDLEGIPHIISISRDISSRKHAEKELIWAKDKAEESDRLKTAFLHNLSYEIRTPMNAIMGFSELMLHHYNNKPRLEKYSAIISKRSMDLLRIIDQILNYAKIESGEVATLFEEFKITSLFEEINSTIDEIQVDNDSNLLFAGTGLGLSIVKGLVSLINGDLWLKSELGHGSTFYFSLPPSQIM